MRWGVTAGLYGKDVRVSILEKELILKTGCRRARLRDNTPLLVVKAVKVV